MESRTSGIDDDHHWEEARSRPATGRWSLPLWMPLVSPIVVPLFVVGVSFGVIAREAEMGIAGAVTMSVTTF